MGNDPEVLGRERVRLGRRRMFPEPAEDGVSEDLRPFARWQKAALVALALLVAVGWYADRRIGDSEARANAACDQDLWALSHEYDVRMGSTLDYIQPALSVLPQAQISRLMARPARQLLASARATLRRCRAGRVLPWHATNVAHRAAYLAYSSALVRRVRTVAEGTVAFQVEDRRLTRLRAVAGISSTSGP